MRIKLLIHPSEIKEGDVFEHVNGQLWRALYDATVSTREVAVNCEGAEDRHSCCVCYFHEITPSRTVIVERQEPTPERPGPMRDMGAYLRWRIARGLLVFYGPLTWADNSHGALMMDYYITGHSLKGI